MRLSLKLRMPSFATSRLARYPVRAHEEAVDSASCGPQHQLPTEESANISLNLPIPIDLLPVFRAGNLDDLLAHYPTGHILACDFYIAGAELGIDVPGGCR